MASTLEGSALTEVEPKILAFCCNWAGYTSINNAGLNRISYPHNVRIIRSMCSARVDPVFVLESLIKGADGVLVLSCGLGECYYNKGNETTSKRMKYLKKSLEKSGVDPRRLRLEQISAYEGERFAEIIEEMTRELRDLKISKAISVLTPTHTKER